MGEYYADLLVNNLVIIEVKATDALAEEHEAQLLNYLKATPYEVGLLLNFGPEPQVKRKAFENTGKKHCLGQRKQRLRGCFQTPITSYLRFSASICVPSPWSLNHD